MLACRIIDLFTFISLNCIETVQKSLSTVTSHSLIHKEHRGSKDTENKINQAVWTLCKPAIRKMMIEISAPATFRQVYTEETVRLCICGSVLRGLCIPCRIQMEQNLVQWLYSHRLCWWNWKIRHSLNGVLTSSFWKGIGAGEWRKAMCTIWNAPFKGWEWGCGSVKWSKSNFL